LDVAKEKAIWEDGDSDGEFADADADWTDAEGVRNTIPPAFR